MRISKKTHHYHWLREKDVEREEQQQKHLKKEFDLIFLGQSMKSMAAMYQQNWKGRPVLSRSYCIADEGKLGS